MTSRSAYARMPSLGMLAGVFVVAVGIYRDYAEGFSNELIVYIGIAINQYLLIDVTVSLRKQVKEHAESLATLREIVEGIRDVEMHSGALLVATREDVRHIDGVLSRSGNFGKVELPDDGEYVPPASQPMPTPPRADR